jgi:hypothetical protein
VTVKVTKYFVSVGAAFVSAADGYRVEYLRGGRRRPALGVQEVVFASESCVCVCVCVCVCARARAHAHVRAKGVYANVCVCVCVCVQMCMCVRVCMCEL